MERTEMIAEIVNFVTEHRESTASIAVTSRILGRSDAWEMGKEDLVELEKRLAEVDKIELETCYSIIS